MCSLLQLTDSLSISFSIDCENSIDKLSTVQLLCKDSQFFLLAQPLINGFLHHLELLNDTRLQRCLQLGEILLSQAVVEWLPKDPFPILNTLRAHIDLISTIEKWTDTDKFLRFWDPRMKLLIQTHWESIFSGTVEVTLELYRSWLKLKAKLSSDGMFTSELQNYFNSCLWFDKGHFNGIATVIEFLTVDQV